jgi:FkbM family methyltransferase
MQPGSACSLPPVVDPARLEEFTPAALTDDQRVEMTTRCRDMDGVPRVPGAGHVQILPDQTCVQIMHNGIRVLADGYYGRWMTRLIELCHGCHEPQEERVFHEVMSRLPTRATMIELGGFWAFYSLWFLSSGKHRRSVVVEPDPKHLSVGQTNARLNGLTPSFVHACVGGTPSGPMAFKAEESGEVLVPCLSVPLLIESQAIERLNVLHCDIQGAEFDVLSSCTDLFRQGRIQFVFVSTHDFRISGDPLTHQRCLAVIRNCGGRIIAEHDVHESYSGDGLIVAYFGDDELQGRCVPVSRNRYSESLFRNPLYDLAEWRTTRNRDSVSQR